MQGLLLGCRQGDLELWPARAGECAERDREADPIVVALGDHEAFTDRRRGEPRQWPLQSDGRGILIDRTQELQDVVLAHDDVA